MVQPADGPSFGVAPSGTWRWCYSGRRNHYQGGCHVGISMKSCSKYNHKYQNNKTHVSFTKEDEYKSNLHGLSPIRMLWVFLTAIPTNSAIFLCTFITNLPPKRQFFYCKNKGISL